VNEVNNVNVNYLKIPKKHQAPQKNALAGRVFETLLYNLRMSKGDKLLSKVL